MKQDTLKLNIGISEEDRGTIADGLSRVLADTYTLYLKTHNFHWNVTGPRFSTLHQMFETQYTELHAAIDEIAERIRSLGYFAPGSYRQFGELSSVKDAEGVPKAEQMLQELLEGHETVIRTARKLFEATDRASDEGTADLLTTRIETHEKTAWMLRSMLE